MTYYDLLTENDNNNPLLRAHAGQMGVLAPVKR